MLAGMISAPSGYDPVLHPVAAKERRHQVLVAMRETGVIDAAAIKAFDKYPLPTRTFSVATIAPTSYFVAEVVQRLLADPRLGPDVPTRRNLIYHGGLTITTDLRPDDATRSRGFGEEHDRGCVEPQGNPRHGGTGRDRQLQRCRTRDGERELAMRAARHS